MQAGATPAGDLTPREKILLAEYAEVRVRSLAEYGSERDEAPLSAM